MSSWHALHSNLLILGPDGAPMPVTWPWDACLKGHVGRDMLCAQPRQDCEALQASAPGSSLLPHSAAGVPQAESMHSLPSSEDEASWQWVPPDGLLDRLTFKFCTALHLAAYYGHVNVLESLQTGSGCDMHARNQQVWRPSHTVEAASC